MLGFQKKIPQLSNISIFRPKNKNKAANQHLPVKAISIGYILS